MSQRGLELAKWTGVGKRSSDFARIYVQAFLTGDAFPEGGLDESAIERAIEATRRGYEEAVRTNGAWLADLDHVTFNQLDLSSLARFPALLDELTVEEVAAAATTYLPSDRYVQLLLLPAGD